MEGNKIQNIQKEFEEVKAEVLNTPENENTTINKELLKVSLQLLLDEKKSLSDVEKNQNANFKKVLDTFDKTIDTINALLQKDTVTDVERKYYVNLVEKNLDEMKELEKRDYETKEKDKEFHRDLVKKGVNAISAIGIIAVLGEVGKGIIKALKK